MFQSLKAFQHTEGNPMKDRLLRILIIGDSKDYTQLLICALKKGGYNPVYKQVKTATAMEKALKEKKWDIIFCDYKMPNFNASLAIALLKEIEIDIPIIIVSGAIGEERVAECMRLGARDYILKSNLTRLCPVIARELEYVKVRNKQKRTNDTLASIHRHVEEKLRESEEKYHSLFKNSIDAILLTVPDRRILAANPAACQMFGRSEEEICRIGRRRILDKTNPRLEAGLEERRRTGRFEGELTYVRKDGTKFVGDTSTSIFKDRDDNLRTCIIIRDITERKRVESILQKNEERLSGITKNLPGTVFQFYATDDGKYGVTYASERVAEIFGLSPSNIDAFFPSFLSLVYEEDRDRFLTSIKSAVETITPWNFEGRIALPSGKMVWFQGLSIPTRYENQTVFNGILLNITKRKLAEEKSRQSEEKFRKIFMTTPDCIGITRLKDGILVDVNKGCEDMLGWKRENVIGKKTTEQPLNFWVDLSAREFMVAQLKAGRDVLHREIEFRRGDGSMRNGIYSARTINIDDEECLIFILQDITERKQVEEALINSHRRLDEIIDFLPDATFVIDHEGKIITWNKATEMITGVSKADMIGRGNYEYAIPFYGERRPLLVDLALLPDDVFENSHYENVYRQGDTLYAEAYLQQVYGGKGAFMWGTASRLRDASGNIIGAIESVRDITERKKAENELKLFAGELEDANIALRVLMNRRDKDQKKFEEKLQVNINDLVIPYLKKLKMGNLDNRNKNYVSVLESNLNNVLSPFMRDIRSSHKNLTPQEIQIVDLIRQGKNTKEIANMLNASVNTIATHRNNLRKKLNLRNSKINLRSHILSYE
jgi:PAS domain S-box-containing protein